MKSRTDKNSTTAAVAGFQGSMGSVPLPEGVLLRSEIAIQIAALNRMIRAVKPTTIRVA